MNKTKIVYQRWFLRFFSFVIVMFLIDWGVEYLASLSGVSDGNFVVKLIVSIIDVSLAYIFLHSEFFHREGVYWTEDGILFLKKGKKTYELKNVKNIYGTTISYFGFARSGALRITLENKTIVLISPWAEGIKNFSHTELLYLFETILEYNLQLKKDDEEDFWYAEREKSVKTNNPFS